MNKKDVNSDFLLISPDTKLLLCLYLNIWERLPNCSMHSPGPLYSSINNCLPHLPNYVILYHIILPLNGKFPLFRPAILQKADPTPTASAPEHFHFIIEPYLINYLPATKIPHWIQLDSNYDLNSRFET